MIGGKESFYNAGAAGGVAWVRSLHLEDPLEEGMATYSSILAGKSHRGVHGVAKSQTQLKQMSTVQ